MPLKEFPDSRKYLLRKVFPGSIHKDRCNYGLKPASKPAEMAT